jgi:hypothetical protein
VPSLDEYRNFISEVDGSCAQLEGSIVERCPAGCSECCGPQTVHPVEAYAILKGAGPLRAWRKGGDQPAERCTFLSAECACRIYPARPFLCRARGVPALHRAAEGGWVRDCCPKKRFLAGHERYSKANAFGLHLEQWKARLNRVNDAFCLTNAIPNRPIRLADLFRAPWIYFALFEYVRPTSQEPGLSMA